MNNYDLLPEWMKKFPPNYRITLPGVGGYIQEEVYEEVYRQELPFFFHVQRTADLGDISLPITDGEELWLTEQASAWLQTNDIWPYCSNRGGPNAEKYSVDDNVYWTYLPLTPTLHKIWLNYWENQDYYHFLINYSKRPPQVIK
ncbi:MAG: hypothetical protein GY751_20185 [Bacteroidetes bacterium]|nr:hypothetical protein [Bacteroidota bacterium]